MILKKGKLVLRTTVGDDEELIALFQNADELLNMSETRVYPDGMPTEMVFRIEIDNVLIGEVRLKNLRWFNRKAELSIIIHEEHQGKGYGREVLEYIIEYAFDKMNLHRLEAEALEFNEISISLLEKLGFQPEGRLREAKYHNDKYWDILRYGLLKSEYKSNAN
jgi:RimJ/RimL family protein N-acetyltransferase